MNKAIPESILEGAETIGRERKTLHRNVIKESISTLMAKRRDMKVNENYRNKGQYVKLCKTIRKRIREEIRNRNYDQIRETIKNIRSIKRAIQKKSKSKRILTSLTKQDGSVTNNKIEIMDCINKFYLQLYTDESEDETDEQAPENDESKIPYQKYL